MEGILYALTSHAADLLLERVTANSAPGSTLALDHQEDSKLLRGARAALSKELVDIWHGGPSEDLNSWLAHYGWQPEVHALEEVTTAHGRPVPPPSTRSAPTPDGAGSRSAACPAELTEAGDGEAPCSSLPPPPGPLSPSPVASARSGRPPVPDPVPEASAISPSTSTAGVQAVQATSGIFTTEADTGKLHQEAVADRSPATSGLVPTSPETDITSRTALLVCQQARSWTRVPGWPTRCHRPRAMVRPQRPWASPRRWP